MNSLDANIRETKTKGELTSLRDNGNVPAIIYGGEAQNEKVAISKKLLKSLIEKENFLSNIISLNVDGKTQNVLPKEIKYDIITDEPIHVDFLRVVPGVKIKIEVPVKFINHESSPGLKRGGVLNIVRRKVELKCPSEKIPENLVIDLDGIDIGESFKISSITLDEEVVPTIQGRDFVIATLAAPTVMKEPEKPAEAEAAEGEEGAAGAEAAPADGDKPAAESAKKEGEDKKPAEEKKISYQNWNLLPTRIHYMLLFVGLGNPTPDSENNRHNVGFKIIDSINKKFSLSKQKPKFKGLLTTGNVADQKIYAIKPLTFMNNSGICIRELIEYFKIDAEDVIVFHDDLDVEFGKIKAKFGGSSAGHNGIASIDKFIGKDYSRVRVGIGKPKDNMEISDYVLQNFDEDEITGLEKITNDITDSISILVNKKLDLFSSTVNNK